MLIVSYSPWWPGWAQRGADRRDARLEPVLLPDLTGTLLFADEDDNTRALLGLGASGASTLVFADPTGESRLGMGVEADGRPTFSMTDSTRESVPSPDGR